MTLFVLHALLLDHRRRGCREAFCIPSYDGPPDPKNLFQARIRPLIGDRNTRYRNGGSPHAGHICDVCFRERKDGSGGAREFIHSLPNFEVRFMSLTPRTLLFHEVWDLVYASDGITLGHPACQVE